MGTSKSKLTFVSATLTMGEFDLPPGDPAWEQVNCIDERAPLIAFPGTTVGISHEGHREVMADPMRAIVYSAGQPYRRRLASSEGDRCSFISFSGLLAAEAARPFDAAADDPVTYRFPFTASPLSKREYLCVQRVRRKIARGSVEDAEVCEALLWVIGGVISSAYRANDARTTRRRSSTVREHRDTVETVIEVLGRDVAAQLTLEGLAGLVHVSPFHLARTFREGTGRSIHQYRTELRLRAAVRRIADGENLADVAAGTGFTGQAHLTDRFGQAYQTTPGAWRQSIDRFSFDRTALETSTIVEAWRQIARLA